MGSHVKDWKFAESPKALTMMNLVLIWDKNAYNETGFPFYWTDINWDVKANSSTITIVLLCCMGYRSRNTRVDSISVCLWDNLQ